MQLYTVIDGHGRVLVAHIHTTSCEMEKYMCSLEGQLMYNERSCEMEMIEITDAALLPSAYVVLLLDNNA